MGAWNYKSFDNDDAMDWVYELEKSEGDVLLLSTMEQIINEPENLNDATICSCVVAAAEVIAACKGSPVTELPVPVQDWVANNFLENVDNLSEMAVETLTMIVSSSELKELWEESDNYTDWLNILNKLIKRLS
jgi:hypothetical protein